MPGRPVRAVSCVRNSCEQLALAASYRHH